MSRPRMDPIFRKELGIQFKKAFERQNRSLAQVARELGITKQALHQYLEGTTVPSPHRLPLVLKKLGLSRVTYRKQVFRAEVFGPAQQQKPPAATQLSLLDGLDTLRNADLVVKILNKSSDSLRLGVEIKFAARA